MTVRPPGLVDVLDRILDKGLVIAGDIKISLANVELLTIQIRLLICSIDKAEQIGLNWWRYSPFLTGTPATPADQQAEIARLQERIAELERQLAPGATSETTPVPASKRRANPRRTA